MSLLSKVKDYKGLFSVAALSAALTFAPNALAQDFTKTSNQPHPDEYCTLPQGGYECATAGYEEPMTEQEIIDSGVSEGRVVYHFGKGLLDAGLFAQENNESGVPTLAIPGGPDNGFVVYLDGFTNGRAYNQYNLNGGAVNYAIQRAYRLRYGLAQANDVQATQVTAINGRAPN